MKTQVKKPIAVKSKLAKTNSLRKLFIDQLKYIMWSERALIKIMRKIGRNASSPNLICLIADNDEIIIQQVNRLENIFEIINIKANGKKCAGMEGLITECENILEDTQEGPVRDAGIIAALQKILHYKIPAYRTLDVLSRTLSKATIGDILKETLSENQKLDALFSNSAYNTINFDAAIDENKTLASHYTNRVKL